jgi:hypothetical protein
VVEIALNGYFNGENDDSSDDNPTLFSDHDKPKWGEVLGEINHLTSLMVLKWFKYICSVFTPLPRTIF